MQVVFLLVNKRHWGSIGIAAQVEDGVVRNRHFDRLSDCNLCRENSAVVFMDGTLCQAFCFVPIKAVDALHVCVIDKVCPAMAFFVHLAGLAIDIIGHCLFGAFAIVLIAFGVEVNAVGTVTVARVGIMIAPYLGVVR